VWALRSATSAALVLNARYEAARAWAAQLDNSKQWSNALSELATITTGSSSGSGTTNAEREQIVALRQRWEKFLAKHERDIRKGHTFDLGDPELPENLFAPHMQLTRKDGTSWPTKK
jgi:hypothetical protein